MGKCFSAMGRAGGRGLKARQANSLHMGPDGVESSIFGEDIFSKSDGCQPRERPLQKGAPDERVHADVIYNDNRLGAEASPLDNLASSAPGATGQSAAVEPHSAQTPPAEDAPKQAVMKRSFPPVGVSLHIEEDMRSLLVDARSLAAVQREIAETIARVFRSSADRFRVMEMVPSVPPATMTIKLNIVADKRDSDIRSPMQLAAEMVTQSQQPSSELRQAQVFRGLRSGTIAEDPFPGTKQDSWAGGVATIRSSAVGSAGSDSSAPTQPAPGKRKKSARSMAAAAASLAESRTTDRDAGLQHDGVHRSKTEDVRDAAADVGRVGRLDEKDKELQVTNTAELESGSIDKDGGIYTGELLRGKRHGRGKQVYANGDVFTGCFQDDRRAGIGRLDFSPETDDGGFYLGEWADDQPNGKGSLTYGSKDMYVGSWVKGMREGEGKLLWASGAWYQGEFRNDEMHGSGTLQKQNQDKYQGEFFAGKFHGRGSFTPAGGVSRMGYWCMGEEVVGKSEAEARRIINEALLQVGSIARDERMMKDYRLVGSGAAPPSGPTMRGGGGRGKLHPAGGKEQPPQIPPDYSQVDQMAVTIVGLQAESESARASPLMAAKSHLHMKVAASDSALSAARDDEPSRPQAAAKRAPAPADGLAAGGGSMGGERQPAGGQRRGIPPPPASTMATKSLVVAAEKGVSDGRGAGGASLSEVKPPTRPQRSGASIKTTDTLTMVAEKLTDWQVRLCCRGRRVPRSRLVLCLPSLSRFCAFRFRRCGVFAQGQG